MSGLVVAFALLVIIFFIGFILASFRHYKAKYNVKYNPRNMFPYELNFEARLKDNWLGNIFILLYSICAIAFYLCLRNASNDGVLLVLIISGALINTIGLFMPFVPVKYMRLHLFIDIIYFVGTFIVMADIGLTALEFYNIYQSAFALCMIIIGFVFALIYFIVLLNPKLTAWAKLDKHENADGTSFYVRPKYFPLAYTEWLTMLFNIIGVILSTLLYFAIL